MAGKATKLQGLVPPIVPGDEEGLTQAVQQVLAFASTGFFPIKEVSSDTTLVTADRIVDVDSSGGSITINLPPLAARAWLVVIKNDAANTVTLDGDGNETINGSATLALTSQWEWALVVGLASEWRAFQ